MTFRISITSDGKLDTLVNDNMAKTLLDLHAGVVPVSPVDTGRFRAAWTVDTTGGVIENNVEYGSALNAGHSKQAPAGFVENEIDKVARL